MKRIFTSFACLLAAMSVSAAEWKKVEPSQHWEGSLDTNPAKAGAPTAIVNEVDFTAAWQACKRIEARPVIDWSKNIAVLVTTRGSRITVGGRIDEKGNLVTNGMMTQDIRPGFRYSLGIFPREGVKMVNGVNPFAAPTSDAKPAR